MEATEYNEWASRKLWSPLPKEWNGYGLYFDSVDFADQVFEFQEEHGLTTDGMLGPKTWAKMQEVYGQDSVKAVEVYGVDVASHQGSYDESKGKYYIDWKLVREAGKRFAIIKATEGSGGYNTKVAHGYVRGVREAGILLNYYHYATPQTMTGRNHITDAKAEAAYFLMTTAELPKADVITFASGRQADAWIDLEEEAERLGSAQGLEWSLALFNTIESAGWKLGLYTSKRWLQIEVDNFERLLKRGDGTERPFFVARYGGTNDGTMPDPVRYDPNKKVPFAWGAYDIWQYSSNGYVPGIEKNVDLDVARIFI